MIYFPQLKIEHSQESEMQTIKKAYGSFSAEIVADSQMYYDTKRNRLTTFVIEFPRIVLAELNTHRMFSRNSASSRAIPVSTMLENVVKNPFIPDRFPKTHKEMQADHDNWVNPGDEEYSPMVTAWLGARDIAVETVKGLDEIGISKQLINRILEPFLMHRVIVTATEWRNFFALRTDYQAQNEIRIIAQLMLDAMRESKPATLSDDEWHIPFGSSIDRDRLSYAFAQLKGTEHEVENLGALRRMIATARCARVSYHNYEGRDDYIADAALYHRLKSSGHMSPFEHVAKRMSDYEYERNAIVIEGRNEMGWSGNFRGFIQLRKMFPAQVENRTFEI